jgi:hypothetical protein
VVETEKNQVRVQPWQLREIEPEVEDPMGKAPCWRKALVHDLSFVESA